MKPSKLDKEKQSIIRKESRRIAWGMIWYQAIIFTCMIGVAIVKTTQIALEKGGNVTDADFNVISDYMMQSGTGYIVAIAFGIPFLWRFFRRMKYDGIFKSTRKMRVDVFFMALVVFMGAQLFFGLSFLGTESILNHFGLTIVGNVESISGLSNTISMFLYASVLGPIAEELIFRGFILRILEKNGKLFAIIVSAILFGFYHGNLLQGIFAMLVGFVLGYVAIEYSIWWTILIHMINNLVFGDLFLLLIKNYSETMQDTILTCFNIVSFIAGIMVLFFNRAKIISYLKTNKTEGYRYVFASVGMILFCILGLVLGFLGIEKMI